MQQILVGKMGMENLTNGTYDRVNVQISLQAKDANVELFASHFDASNVNVLIKYKESKNKEYTLMNDTLDRLAIPLNIRRLDGLKVGTLKTEHSVGVKSVLLLDCVLPLGNFYKTTGGDNNLYVEFTLNKKGVFDATKIDEVKSYVGFETIPAIGYPTAIVETIVLAIKENQQNQTFPLGDNVGLIILVNTDKSDYETEVINNLNLDSDRLKRAFVFDDLIQHQNRFLPVDEYIKTAPSTFREYPQTFTIHEAGVNGSPLDDVSLQIKYNAGTDTNTNYILYQRFNTSAEMLTAAAIKKANHRNKFLSKNR